MPSKQKIKESGIKPPHFIATLNSIVVECKDIGIAERYAKLLHESILNLYIQKLETE